MRRRLALAVLCLGPLALLAPAASAKPPLPCDNWTHGCNVPAYVYEACHNLGVDCGIVKG